VGVLDAKHILDRRLACPIEHRQSLQGTDELGSASVGLDAVPHAIVGHQSHRPVLAQEMMDQRCGTGDPVLDGGRGEGNPPWQERALARIAFFLGKRPSGGSARVQDEPHIAQGVELEFLDDQSPSAGSRHPVNAVEAVARHVLANAGGIGRDLMRGLGDSHAAGKPARWQRKRRKRRHQRQHDQLMHLRDGT
jgi:hypothetical protein